jgi:hypothetical protein
LALTCQRCLDEVKLHLEPKFQLAFVQNEQQGEELGSIAKGFSRFCWFIGCVF